MKKVILKKDLPDPDPQKQATEIYDEIRKCFTVYEDSGLRDKAIQDKANYNVWVSHKFNKELKEKARRRYEDFVCGYLHYYDTEVRNNWIDHSVYFEWGKDYVTIYISPPAINENNYKPSPVGARSHPGSNGKKSDSSQIYENTVGSPPGDAVSDPPPPSGPPPPSS